MDTLIIAAPARSGVGVGVVTAGAATVGPVQ